MMEQLMNVPSFYYLYDSRKKEKEKKARIAGKCTES